MKNHRIVDGRLLQTNKKWGHLKESQKTWIFEVAREEYDAFVSEHKTQPRKHKKELVIDKVNVRVKERNIWIPYGELSFTVNKFIDRLNRRMAFDLLEEHLNSENAQTNNKD